MEKTIRAAVFVVLCLSCSLLAAQPPNVVFVLTDDQRYDEVGFLNPVLETPHMDSLAREGVHFANAFVTTSLCSPSRASILTGQMMHNHGVIDNNRPLPGGLELFPQRLQRAGYQTAFIGKWHMGGAISEPREEFDYWLSFPGQGSYYTTTALDLVAERFSQYKGEQFASTASAKCTNEENYLVQKFTRAVMGSNSVDHCARL